jgi:hypothetical protein
MICGIASLVIALLILTSPGMAQTAEQIFQRHAAAGTLRAGEAELRAISASRPADATARLALGFAQFTVAVERLGQGFHRYGLSAPRQLLIPFLRFPVPDNPNPEKLDYAKLRAVYTDFLVDLAKVEATLSTLPPGDAKLVVDLHSVRLDLNGDGIGQDEERLDAILMRLMRWQGGAGWEVAFDRADATWLRGYAQLLSGMLQFVHAHDWSETYRETAHLFFKGARDPQNPLHQDAATSPMLGRDAAPVADAIAFLHLIRWPVTEPDRLKAAHAHLKQVVALSRQNWREILAETDDDREWLPGPHQNNSAVTALRVTQEQVDGWLAVMETLDATLDGRQMVAHWRFEKGFDLKAVFFEPRTFDLMLWLTGHGARPYLKDGPMTDSSTATQLTRVFGGNFLGFAFWFN